jgi:hypothetical protein
VGAGGELSAGGVIGALLSPFVGPSILIAHGVPDDSIHDFAFSRLLRPARVGYFGAANGDDARWFSRVRDALLRRHGAVVTLCRTVGVDAAARPGLLAAIEGADALYFAGGDVAELAERMHTLDLSQAVRDRHRAGAMMIGVSAGAIGLTRYWVDFPAEGPPVRFPCIGALDLAIDCHDEESDWEELRALLTRWAEDEPDAVVDAYGIPAGGALWVEEGSAPGHLVLPPRRLRLERGRVTDG